LKASANSVSASPNTSIHEFIHESSQPKVLS